MPATESFSRIARPEVVKTSRPYRCRFIAGQAARVMWKGASTLTLRTDSQL
jgi:hypothetical protein